MKSLATIEQYKTFNKVNNNSNGMASKGLQVTTSESDAEIQLYLDAASASIRNYTSRDFTRTRYKEAIINFYGVLVTSSGENINELNSVSQKNYNITKDCYFIGTSIYSDYFDPSGVILVEYISGNDIVPADIIQSCIYLASVMSRKKDRIGEQSVTQSESTTTFIITDLPADIKLILDNYRDWTGMGKIISREEI